MEDGLFLVPAVAALLKKEFVESRIHNDGGDAKRQAEVKAWQQKTVHSLATPIYLILDPRTQEELARFDGVTFKPEVFEEFLKKGLKARS